MSLVRHVDVHDGDHDGTVRHQLLRDLVPWEAQLGAMVDAGYAGSAILEIRYRYASEIGEPWAVLAESYRQVVALIDGDTSRGNRPEPGWFGSCDVK